jgi:hypothetical protein
MEPRSAVQPKVEIHGFVHADSLTEHHDINAMT